MYDKILQLIDSLFVKFKEHLTEIDGFWELTTVGCIPLFISMLSITNLRPINIDFFSMQYRCLPAVNYHPIFTRNLNALAATYTKICFNIFTVS